jgi:hypothetical protein
VQSALNLKIKYWFELDTERSYMLLVADVSGGLTPGDDGRREGAVWPTSLT